MRIPTLIAEAEPRTREALQSFCTRRRDLDLVAQVSFGAEAIDAIESVRPELLLVDSQLPDMTAAQLLQAMPMPEQLFTVLVTNREHMTTNSARPQQVAYLTKPIERCKFDEVIDTAVAHRSVVSAREVAVRDIARERPNENRLLVGERAHRFHFLDTDQVDYLEVGGNYVTIHVGSERFLTRATLKQLSALLAPYDFVRIDRSHLVNLRHVAYVERLEDGRFAFKLRAGQQLSSSKERTPDILRLLKNPLR